MSGKTTEERARETAAALSNLPDEYEPGADGGLYRTVNTERVRAIILAALQAEREQAVEEAKVLLALVESLEKLLVCYRVGRNPGALLDRLHEHHEAARPIRRALAPEKGE